MAPEREYSPYQRKVIGAYYRNQEGIRQQALADLVSDLYLATTEKKKASLWARAKTLLEGLGVPASQSIPVVEKRDVAALAAIAAKGFQTERREEFRRDDRDSRSS
jgi:hypothetical protein